ncbi:hypothetical protein [Verminephrobacter eiseniae]|uniref:hypothetical protein n=1 Tax=Verminephrobacter eiseniae TaxID=364317 RepID=UPI0005A54BC9|nr:hypothetical protein [Verminephrobacter eiseniae]MCW5284994.1 hypothetical protein [Verminephrobacter eiseniae]MCW5302702.1 hypothetical protein [Verminephrobacter eiseniae]MCW8178239.1 hypothetical protein [Verminephrobacter eiseniae]MCW8188969.1 hypothetical protein [Verminephrobacter eiseniae]
MSAQSLPIVRDNARPLPGLHKGPPMTSTTECEQCQRAQTNKGWGCYRMQCLQCCARLVASARPSRPHQEAMLAAIERFPGAPSRDAVLAGLK